MEHNRKIKNEQLTSILCNVLLIVNLLMLLSLAFENESLERFCSYAIIILSFSLYLYSFTIFDIFKIEDFIFALILVYFFVLYLNKQWQYKDIVSALVFLSMLTVWRVTQACVCTEKIKKSIENFYLLQGFILIGISFSSVAYKSYQEYVTVSNELTLGFSNPNQTGIILFSTIAILTIVLMYEKKQIKRVITIIVIAALVYLLFLTKARTSILMLAVLAYALLSKKVAKKHIVLSDFVIISPIIFVYVYMGLADTQLSNLEILGKKLFSGRQRVFREALDSFTDKFFGNLTYFNFQNSHNALLTILVNIGVIGLVLYLVFTIFSFNRFYNNCKGKNQIVVSLIILALFIMGYAEAAVLTGGTIYFNSMFFILLLGNAIDDEKSIKEVK